MQDVRRRTVPTYECANIVFRMYSRRVCSELERPVVHGVLTWLEHGQRTRLEYVHCLCGRPLLHKL
jgi:hypothetical protein